MSDAKKDMSATAEDSLFDMNSPLGKLRAKFRGASHESEWTLRLGSESEPRSTTEHDL